MWGTAWHEEKPPAAWMESAASQTTPVRGMDGFSKGRAPSGKAEERHRREWRGPQGLENENKPDGRVWLRDGVKDYKVLLGLSEKGTSAPKPLFSFL